jgi:hypothetical protein
MHQESETKNRPNIRAVAFRGDSLSELSFRASNGIPALGTVASPSPAAGFSPAAEPLLMLVGILYEAWLIVKNKITTTWQSCYNEMVTFGPPSAVLTLCCMLISGSYYPLHSPSVES